MMINILVLSAVETYSSTEEFGITTADQDFEGQYGKSK